MFELRMPGMNIEEETVIEAPLETVWARLVDFDRHSDWGDNFALEGRPIVGNRARVHFKLFGRPVSHPVVIDIVDEERELRWSGGPKGLVFGSHYFKLAPHGPDGRHTKLVHGEQFSGLAVPLLSPFLGRVIGPAYAGFNRQLKETVESG